MVDLNLHGCCDGCRWNRNSKKKTMARRLWNFCQCGRNFRVELCVGLSLVRLGYVSCLPIIHVWSLAGGGHFGFSAFWDICMEAGGRLLLVMI